jgi:hypothetical protein
MIVLRPDSRGVGAHARRRAQARRLLPARLSDDAGHRSGTGRSNAKQRPGTLYVAYLIYSDDSAYPSELETGLLRGRDLHIERFDNRPKNR